MFFPDSTRMRQAEDKCQRERGHCSPEDTCLGSKGVFFLILDETWLDINHVVKGERLDFPTIKVPIRIGMFIQARVLD